MTDTNMKRDLSSRQAATVETDADGNLVYTPKVTTGGGASTSNVSTTALNNGQTYTGTWELNAFPDVMVTFISDTTGVLRLDFSPDGTNIDTSIPITTHAGQNETHVYVKGPRYFRVRFTNDSGGNATYMRLNTYFGTFNKLTTNVNGLLPHDFDGLAVRSFSEEINIAEGYLQGHFIVNKFGRNPLVGTVTVPEDIWENGGTYTGHPAGGSAELIRITSTSPTDTQNWHIYGLDENWDLQDEVVTATGTSPATSVGTYFRMFRAVNEGSVNTTGTITIQHNTTTANIFSVLGPGINQTRQAVYTIPRNYQGFVRQIFTSLIRAGGGTFDRDADVSLQVRTFGGVWRQVRPYGVSNSSPFVDTIFGGLVVPAKADMKLTVTAVSNDTAVSGGFDMILSETL